MNGRLSTIQPSSNILHTQASKKLGGNHSPKAKSSSATKTSNRAHKSSHKATFTDRYHQEKREKKYMNEGSLVSDIVSLDPAGKKGLDEYLRERHDKLVTHITDDLMLLDPYPTQNQKTWYRH